MSKPTILIVSEEEYSPIPLRCRENRAEQIHFSLKRGIVCKKLDGLMQHFIGHGVSIKN